MPDELAEALRATMHELAERCETGDLRGAAVVTLLLTTEAGDVMIGTYPHTTPSECALLLQAQAAALAARGADHTTRH